MEGDVCIPNIGPQERRKRLRFGVIAVAVGVALAIVLTLTGVNRLFRLGLFLPFWVGALGYLQAREKT